MDTAEELLELAREKFGKLTEVEEKLFRDTVKGEMADYSTGDKKADDPANALEWTSDRVLRASCITWLCTYKQALQFITHHGIQIKRARIDEEFDLEATKVPFPLCFEQCKFTSNINFRHTQASALYMQGTHIGMFSADGLRIEGSVHFRNDFTAKGEVCLRDAHIGGNLDCDSGQFINKFGQALSADRLRVEGCVYFRKGFMSEGEICLFDAKIIGSLECIGGRFFNINGKALLADRLKVGANLFLSQGFKADGEVCLRGATVGGDFVCDQGQFINKDGKTLLLDGLKTGRSFYLRNGFEAKGEVCLINAIISGDLDCTNGKFSNKSGKALSADRAKISSNVFLSNGFEAHGEVRLLGATIGGHLVCDNGQFINKDGNALLADGLRTERCIFLRNGFKAEGVVCLVGAMIDGDFDCNNGQFINKSGKAISADRIKVGSNVFLSNGFKADGTLRFISAIIQSEFRLIGVDSVKDMSLDIRSVKIRTLRDEQKSWPDPERLFLHGFEYKEISDQSPRDSKTRIEWLRLQAGFSPQPYEQLAKVFRESGDEACAKDILIAKNEDKASQTKLTRSQWFWYRLLGPRIGYGHRPLKALRWAFGLVLVGWAFFALGYSSGLITPPGDSAYTTEEEFSVSDPGNPKLKISDVYPVFNSLVYSLDVFVPVVEFHQAKYWLPNANRGIKIIKVGPWSLHTGGLLLFWFWAETVLGWILSTLFIVGLTGFVRT